MPDLLCDLIEDISLLGKSSFNRHIGIEAIFIKGYIPLIPVLINDSSSQQLQIFSMKSFGVFTCQASLIPLRMQNFYKDVIDLKIVQALCNHLKNNQALALQ